MGIFRRRAIDPEARSPQLGLKYKDLQVLGALVENGAKLHDPRHVVHYLYFDSAAQATSAAGELTPHGWQVAVKDTVPEYPGQWGLVAEMAEAVLSPEFVREATDLMEAVARAHDGEYDGWEAAG